MFEVYGNDIETFCVCQKCKKIWTLVNGKWEKTNAIPFNMKSLQPIVYYNIKMPRCH